MTALTTTTIVAEKPASEAMAKAASEKSQDWTPQEKAEIVRDAQREATGGSKFMRALAK